MLVAGGMVKDNGKFMGNRKGRFINRFGVFGEISIFSAVELICVPYSLHVVPV